MKKNIIVISDDNYFMAGISSSLNKYFVHELKLDSGLNIYQHQRCLFNIVDVDMVCAIIISVKCVSLMLKVIELYSNIPVLVVLNDNNHSDFSIKLKNIYILNKHANKMKYNEMINIATSQKKIRELSLSHRQVYIMRLLMAGINLDETSRIAGISLKTASAHKIGFLNRIYAKNIQQAHGVIKVILAICRRL